MDTASVDEEPGEGLPRGETHVEVEGIEHTFQTDEGAVAALADINLRVPYGEVASIVGASGCGKSTLLRIIAGLQAPTAGTVRIEDETVDGVPDSVGVIFQDYDNTLMKWESVYDNVKIGAELRAGGPVDVESETRRFLEMVGLEEFESANPTELSGGMKQRVQFARILAYDPDLLLCDEPFGALDAQTKEILQDEFLEILSTDPTTTLFVTHDIEEAIYVGDSVYVFTEKNPGRIGHHAPVDIERPRFPRTEFQVDHSEETAEMKRTIRSEMRL